MDNRMTIWGRARDDVLKDETTDGGAVLKPADDKTELKEEDT